MHPYLVNRAVYVEQATLPGKLFNAGHYPAAIPVMPHCRSVIQGEVYRLLQPAQVLAILDEYEECSSRFPPPHEYERVSEIIMLASGKQISAWVYWYRHSTAGLRHITSGDYFDDLFTPGDNLSAK